MPSFKPERLHVQNPHNYEGIPGKLAAKDKKEDKTAHRHHQDQQTPANARLAQQLAKRKSEADTNPVRQRQKAMFSNAVIDQPKLNWPDFMDL